MIYSGAVQEHFRHLLANDPGGHCHFVKLLKVAQQEIKTWKGSAQPPAPQRRRQRLKVRMTPHPCLRSAGFTPPQPAMAGSEPSGLAGGPHESLRPEVPAQRASASVSLKAPLAQGEEPLATQQAGARGPAMASTRVPHAAHPVQGQKRTPRGEKPLATQQAGAGGPATASPRVPHTARPVQGQKQTPQGEEPLATQQAGARGPATASKRVPHAARPAQGQKQTQAVAGRQAQASKRGSVEDSTNRATRNPVPASVAKGRKRKASRIRPPVMALQLIEEP